MKSYKFLIFLFTGILFLYAPETESAGITAAGGWTETINSADLVSGAGSDLISAYESAANATIIDIAAGGLLGSGSWRVDVKRTDAVWHGNFILCIKRTSDGSGDLLSSISGGFSYIEITTVNTQFFTGSRDRTGINLQYKLTGMSVNIPAGAYTTTVTYTVTDT